MKKLLSDTEKRILAALQHGLPQTLTPYEDVANRAGIPTDQLLNILKGWKKSGKIRRMGAIVNHFNIGLSAGSMVTWQVEPGRVEHVGEILASFDQVSHAYERPGNENWPYNLYTMVHGCDPANVHQTVMEMSNACGVTDFKELTTERELKKVPPTYIVDK